MRARKACLVALVAGTSVLAGCTLTLGGERETIDGVERVVYEDGEGPLGASPGLPGASGGVSIFPPDHRARWQATFGSMFLCSSRGAPIEIEKVSAHFPGPAAPATFVVRHVQTAHPDRDGSTPIGSMKGWPRSAGLEGTFVAPAGVVVTGSCTIDRARFDELMLTLDVGPDGAAVDKVFVDYTVYGQRSRVVVPWEFVACGEKLRHHEMCEGSD